MTDLLERAVETARTLSPDMQDEIARMVLAYAGSDEHPIQLTPEEIADLEASDAEATRGEFATDEQMRAIWTKHGARSCASPFAPRGRSKPLLMRSRRNRHKVRAASGIAF